jgi:hypothetical protein
VAISQPMLNILRVQEQAAAALRAPALQALQNQEALNRALAGPLQNIAATSAQMQRMLEGPLGQVRRNQEALRRAITGPYAGILQNQEMFLRAMGAAAAAAEFDSDTEIEDVSAETRWLAQWADAIRDWQPSVDHVRELLLQLPFGLRSGKPGIRPRPTHSSEFAVRFAAALLRPPSVVAAVLDVELAGPVGTLRAGHARARRQARKLTPRGTHGQRGRHPPKCENSLKQALPRGERRDSNPRPPGPQPGALPTELRPPGNCRPNLATNRAPAPAVRP